jgi:hypothetical protein
MITVFFSSKKLFASANPIPEAPPVIKTALLLNFIVISLDYRPFLSHPPEAAARSDGPIYQLNRLARGVQRVLPVRVEAVVIWRLSFHFYIFIGLTRKNWLRFFSESTLDCRMAVLTFLTN